MVINNKKIDFKIYTPEHFSCYKEGLQQLNQKLKCIEENNRNNEQNKYYLTCFAIKLFFVKLFGRTLADFILNDNTRYEQYFDSLTELLKEARRESQNAKGVIIDLNKYTERG